MDRYEHTPVTVADKRAVVVGGTSGIGEAIALGFASEGADVIATSRSREKVESTAATIRNLGADTAAVTCDVTDTDSLARVRDVTTDEFGGVDVVVASHSRSRRQ